MTKPNRSQAGQSLIEAIIGVTILITGLVTTMALGLMTIRAGQVSQSRTIADNLAREGIEVIRNIRDTNWLIDIDKINVENGDPLRCGIDTGPVRWDTCFCNTNDDTVTLELTPGTGWALNPDPDDIDSDAALVYLVSAVDPDDPPSYYTQAPAGNIQSNPR
ncbi:MAG: hypothetical protein UY81_C0016G0009 [Candidatus Giovannonibacteria bacterium GW2011_GWA2_53_7]|uniref:Type II secretion system protein n=1 Tax=Candidatus Giovannonibacteria bacterium GW2011_GWA2_53_7 TaxID=1618650 RepID=A0A0G2AV20_9BACT|nr:MAG: hypothetical protein UY81_C0016G0009 [Candidatus Giovannonibacteria bacterium GW2011_GWA2_53_7]